MLALALAAQALRWWCIDTLGPRWNTRVIVVPGLPRVTGGPYRLVSHPNYVAVVVEGAALPLVHGAWITARRLHRCSTLRCWRSRLRCENAALATLPPLAAPACARDRPAGRRRRPGRAGHRDPRGPGRARRGGRRAAARPDRQGVRRGADARRRPRAGRARRRRRGAPAARHPLPGRRATGPRRASGARRAAGVRRTALHAALARRAAELGVPVVPLRVGAVRQDADGRRRAAGITARYLAAADGLHSPIRRAARPGPARPAPAPVRAAPALRGPPWTDCVEVHWSRARGGVRHPGRPRAGRRRRADRATRAPFDDHLAAFPGWPARLPAAAATAARGAGPLRQRVARPGGRPGPAGRRRRRLHRRAHRRGHLARAGGGRATGALRTGRPAAGLRAGLAPGDAAAPPAHRVAAVGPPPAAPGPAHRPRRRPAPAGRSPPWSTTSRRACPGPPRPRAAARARAPSGGAPPDGPTAASAGSPAPGIIAP